MPKIVKFSLVILIISLILPIFPAQAAGDAVFKLSSVKTDYYIGDTVYIDIMVEPNGADLNTIRAIMDYSGGNIIDINDFNLGTAWPNLSPGKELNNTTDHINVGGFILVDSVNTNAKFGTLIFKASTIGSSIISFTNNSHLIDINQVDQINLGGCQNITINVIGAAPPPSPPPPINQAPVFQPVGNKAINLGDSLTFHVQATDPEGDLITLTWNIPQGAVFNNVINNGGIVSGDFSWTPINQGVFNAIFTAVDVNGNSTTLTVAIGVSVLPPPINHPPIFEPVTEKTINAGESLTFNVSATDLDGDTVTLSLEPLETAALSSITSGATATSRFNWIPQNFGIYYAVFKATDNILNPLTSILTVRITVFGGACPPCGGGACPICQCEKIEGGKITEKSSPVINSPTHPNQDTWYANNQPQFVWQPYQEAENYIFNLDQNPLTELDYGYLSSQEKMFSFNNISDGFWYFHLRAKYAEGYTQVTHYQIKIDTAPPEFFKPTIEGNNLVFSALDKGSGVAYYEMKIDGGNWQKVTSPLNLDEISGQGSRLTLRAVDNAGNAIEAYVDLQKKEVLAAEEQKKYIVEEFVKIIEPPLIDSVSFEQIRGKLAVEEYLVITGQAAPNSTITVHLSTEPETIFNAQADGNGNWLAKLKKELAAQKYSLYAIASLNGLNSQPSERVYFTLLEKFIPSKTFYIPWWYWIPIIILIGLVIYLWRKDKRLGNALEKLKKIYAKSKKQNNHKR
ncbi:MAG: hypothetical protein A2Y82_04975 [Candidatus Buchananbacteria bacterium RBG_13_36_9]|uniref:Cohesin domain-containing protein n=1 Tax=Candidatus Buchananbacteria bacterium RBG_13_36_9 TaxID=1797530 RepID=A0A1G1XQD0_9BACT|nr:MAG: hypothetical protein A2Y82_04975 [Candidatus Buchananbacteria bacterium RBG_13_36_9]